MTTRVPSPPSLVAPGVWRVELPVDTLPPFESTNAYVLAAGGVSMVVDPGSGAPEAVEAVARAVQGAGSREPKAIVLTHTHRDHVGGLAALLDRWPHAATYAHPLELEATGVAGAKALSDGRTLTLGSETVEAVHTPGHSPGHLALWLERPRVLVAGDLVAGAGSVWVGAPYGDVAAYLESLARAAAKDPATVAPGHGPVRRDGAAVFHEARAHRLERERALLAALRPGPLELATIRERIYGELAPPITDLAARSLLAHLRKLMAERRVMHVGDDERGPYALAPGESRPGEAAS